ncbi:MAG: WD40 repeat domain-containing protein [Myxococcota bacterium]
MRPVLAAGEVPLWLRSPSRHTRRGHVCAVAFSPEQRRIAFGTTSGEVTVLDLQSGRRLHTLAGRDEVCELVFSASGTLTSVSTSYEVKVWDLQRGKCLRTFGSRDEVRELAFSDNKKCITVSWTGEVKTWEPQNGQCLSSYRLGELKNVECVQISARTNRLASCSKSGEVSVWNLQSGNLLYSHSVLKNSVLKNYRFASAIAFSADGKYIAICEALVGGLHVYDVQTGAVFKTFAGCTFAGEQALTKIVFSPAGDRIAFGSAAGRVTVWDLQSGRCPYTLDGRHHLHRVMNFSPDSRFIVTESADRSGITFGYVSPG